MVHAKTVRNDIMVSVEEITQTRCNWKRNLSRLLTSQASKDLSTDAFKKFFY